MTVSCLSRVAGRLALLAALAAPTAAQAGFDDVFPEDTLMWFAADDVSGYEAAFARTAQGRLFADPGFAPLIEELERGVQGWVEMGRERLGVDLWELATQVEGALAFGLVEVVPPSEAGAEPAVALALLAELREDSGELVLDDLDLLAEKLVEAEPDQVVLKFEERAGVPASLLVGTEGDATIAWAVDEGVLAITMELGAAQESETLETLLFALRGEGESALNENPRFAASALTGAADPSRVRVWLDVPGFLQTMLEAQGREGLPPPPEIEQFGLDALGPLSLLTRIDDTHKQRQHMELSWGADFFLAPLLDAARGSGAPVAFDWMPPDAEFGVALDLDVPALFDAGLDMLSEAQPDAAREVVTGMAAAEGELGFHPRDDLMEALSGQFGFFAREPAGGIAPGDMFGAANSFALVAGLRDAALMGEFFDAVIRGQGLHVARQREVFEGFEVFALPVFPGITLHYSLGGDVLVLSTNGDHVRDVLRRRADPELASFGNAETMRASRAQLPDEAVVLFAMDAAASLEGMLELPSQMAEMFAVTGETPPMLPWGDDELRLDALLRDLAALLPSREIVRKHVEGYALTSMQLGASGVSVESTSP